MAHHQSRLRAPCRAGEDRSRIWILVFVVIVAGVSVLMWSTRHIADVGGFYGRERIDHPGCRTRGRVSGDG